jgi:hypothetical protein
MLPHGNLGNQSNQAHLQLCPVETQTRLVSTPAFMEKKLSGTQQIQASDLSPLIPPSNNQEQSIHQLCVIITLNPAAPDTQAPKPPATTNWNIAQILMVPQRHHERVLPPIPSPVVAAPFFLTVATTATITIVFAFFDGQLWLFCPV